MHLGLGEPPWAAFQVLVDLERGEPPAARNPEMNRLCFEPVAEEAGPPGPVTATSRLGLE